jgi:catechol 2,3-dioxygenase-like lactoylglutathione lyase family enzyme
VRLALVTVVVPDYDEAIAFYVGALGFHLREDTDLGGGKRWVVVAPDDGAAILLARADGDDQRARVGDQTGGRVGFFLHTDDFDGDHARLRDAGVRFVRPVTHERWGTVTVFEDRYGNRWDLIEPK